MAVTQVGSLIVRLRSILTGELDFNSVIRELNKNFTITFDDGSGVDQANMVWSDQRTLAASATEDLDFAGGLTNAFGIALTFTKVKLVLIFAAIGNTNNVRVTRPASNGLPIFLAAGDGLDIGPGGCFIFAYPAAAGVAVTAGTGDLLTITNAAAGTSVLYDIVVLGVV